MKKVLVLVLGLTLVGSLSLAQLTPGNPPGGGPGRPPVNSNQQQMLEQLDIAKYEIRSALQAAGLTGGNMTISSYLNSAISRIDFVQSQIRNTNSYPPTYPGNPGNPGYPGNTIACYNGICVNDLVYKGNSYSQGAKVLAMDINRRIATIKSVSSGSVFDENLDQLHATRGCIGRVCVGSLVYRGSTYSMGATVLGVNSFKNTVTVKSRSSGNLFEENVYSLTVN